jgi:hypothetical protein
VPRDDGGARRKRTRPAGRAIALAVAGLLVLAGAAFAAVGLQNPSFEDGLTGWSASTIREDVYSTPPTPQPATDCQGIDGDAQRAICVVGDDTFTPDGGSPVTVHPLDGSKMVRLGGPFTSNHQHQFQDRYRLKQTFTVDPANPVLKLNYNVFLFDYSGFDELRFNVRLTDENGDEITSFVQGGFGAPGNIELKTTGWRSAFIDLTGYENQAVHLTIDSGGTQDRLYGFWAYVDAGEGASQPVSPPSYEAPVNPVTNQPVPINAYTDDASGQTFIAIPHSQVGQFPGGCMPLDMHVPIDGGTGIVSDVTLIHGGGSLAMTFGNGTWNAQIPCVSDGDMAVQYTVNDHGTHQTFVVPIGGISLVDPAGTIYDQPAYDAKVAAGQSPADARAATAITGARVRLQRKVGADFHNVLSGDPGISPHLNRRRPPPTASSSGSPATVTTASSSPSRATSPRRAAS